MIPSRAELDATIDSFLFYKAQIAVVNNAQKTGRTGDSQGAVDASGLIDSGERR